MRHPQADLIMQVATIRAEGMCEHWEGSNNANYWSEIEAPNQIGFARYAFYLFLRMKPSHPDYNTDKNPNRPKPVLKPIDMSKLPEGTMTNCGEIIGKSAAVAYVLNFESLCPNVIVYCYEELRLAEQTKWTAWTGGECPVPEGCKYKWMGGYGAIFNMTQPHGWRAKEGAGRVAAYRITGVAEGYTDGSL